MRLRRGLEVGDAEGSRHPVHWSNRPCSNHQGAGSASIIRAAAFARQHRRCRRIDAGVALAGPIGIGTRLCEDKIPIAQPIEIAECDPHRDLKSARNAQSGNGQGIGSKNFNGLRLSANEIGVQPRQIGPIIESEGQRLWSGTPNALQRHAVVSVAYLAEDAMEIVCLSFDLSRAFEDERGPHAAEARRRTTVRSGPSRSSRFARADFSGSASTKAGHSRS